MSGQIECPNAETMRCSIGLDDRVRPDPRGWITANVTPMAIRTDKTRTKPARRGKHTIHRYAVAWRITIALFWIKLPNLSVVAFGS